MGKFVHFSLCAILVLLPTEGALGLGKDDVTKYAYKMILSSCLGESFMTSWEESLKASTEKCFGEESVGAPPTLNSILGDILLRNDPERSGSPPSPENGPPPFPSFFSPPQHSNSPFNILPNLQIPFTHQQQPSAAIHHSPPQHPFLIFMSPSHLPHPQLGPQSPQYGVFDQHFQSKPSSSRLWKRSTMAAQEREVSSRTSNVRNLSPEWRVGERRDAHRPAEVEVLLKEDDDDVNMEPETLRLLKAAPRVDRVRRRLGDRISNITCVLTSMELLDETHGPNYSYNDKLIEHLNVAPPLRRSLVLAHSFCREFAACVPVHRSEDLLTREIGQGLVFLKCLKDNVIGACVKHGMEASAVSSYSGGSFSSPLENLVLRSDGDGAEVPPLGHGLFDDSPEAVAKNLVDFFAGADEVGFGF